MTEKSKECMCDKFIYVYQNGGMHRNAEAAGGDDVDIGFRHFAVKFANKVFSRHDN